MFHFCISSCSYMQIYEGTSNRPMQVQDPKLAKKVATCGICPTCGLVCLCSCSGMLWRINLRQVIGLVLQIPKGKGVAENVMVVLLKIVEIVVTAKIWWKVCSETVLHT